MDYHNRWRHCWLFVFSVCGKITKIGVRMNRKKQYGLNARALTKSRRIRKCSERIMAPCPGIQHKVGKKAAVEMKIVIIIIVVITFLAMLGLIGIYGGDLTNLFESLNFVSW